MKERLLTFDLAKFIAILAVLWGHCIQYLQPGVCYENRVYQIIYSFHMPLFMMISGYFSVRVMDRPFLEHLKAKSIQLLLPGISYAVIICILMKYSTWGGVFETLTDSLWFLKSAFVCFFSYWICTRTQKFMPLALVVTLVGSQFAFKYQLGLMYPCFVFGTLLANNWNRISANSLNWCIATFLIFIVMLLSWDQRFWLFPPGGVYPIKNIDQLITFYPRLGYRLIIGMVGSLFIITLCDVSFMHFKNTSILRKMAEMGKETLGIYLIQTIVIEILLWRWLRFDQIGFWISSLVLAPIVSFAVLYVALLSIKILRRNRWLRLLFLGEKQ